MNQGDVVLVRYPFTDGSGHKLRPALIVSVDRLNSGDDLILTPISSTPGPADPLSVFIGDPDYQVAGLKAASAIKWTKLATIDRHIVTRRLGKLPRNLLDDVIKKIVSVFQ